MGAGLLFSSAFRYGAAVLEKFLRVLQQLPCAVVSGVGAGHGLAHCCSSFLDLGTHACGTIWFVLQRALAELSPHGRHL